MIWVRKLRMNAHTYTHTPLYASCMVAGWLHAHLNLPIEFGMGIQYQYSIWCGRLIFFNKSLTKATKRELNGKSYDIR